MSKINFMKPDKENLNTFLYLGSALFFIGILDVFLNSFYSSNITGFLPSTLSFIFPLIIGFIGLFFISKTLLEESVEDHCLNTECLR